MAAKNKTEYDMRYAKENLKRIPLNVQKEKYDQIKAAADNAGEKVNSYIKKAIDERMERENAAPDTMDTSMDIVPEVKAEKQEHTPKPPKKKKTHYKPFTESDARRIDFPELLHNIRYQIDISDTYGMDVLSTLLEKARQQETEKTASE